jgi:tRNA threonylcarbamoyladenosine biosynthesis protein TsaE
MSEPTATWTLDLPDPEATAAFGHLLGGLLFPGAVVALVGPLGAGKTHLVRAVAEGLGLADGRQVASPTFVLIREYPARLPIYHFDAYRLKDEGEFLDLGAHEYLTGNGVCLIEWADRVPGCLPPKLLRLTLTITGETSRRLHLEAVGDTYAALARRLADEDPPHLSGTG